MNLINLAMKVCIRIKWTTRLTRRWIAFILTNHVEVKTNEPKMLVLKWMESVFVHTELQIELRNKVSYNFGSEHWGFTQCLPRAKMNYWAGTKTQRNWSVTHFSVIVFVSLLVNNLSIRMAFGSMSWNKTMVTRTKEAVRPTAVDTFFNKWQTRITWPWMSQRA